MSALVAKRLFTTKASTGLKISSSLAEKSIAMNGPRFEQTRMDLQPNPLPAIELIAKVPVKMVHSRKISCDGGGNLGMIYLRQQN
jgi:exopolysaccharide biosynthesis predicted pyruvyltransferase EpsI